MQTVIYLELSRSLKDSVSKLLVDEKASPYNDFPWVSSLFSYYDPPDFTQNWDRLYCFISFTACVVYSSIQLKCVVSVSVDPLSTITRHSSRCMTHYSPSTSRSIVHCSRFSKKIKFSYPTQRRIYNVFDPSVSQFVSPVFFCQRDSSETA